jgi:hypothetical protein
LLSIFGVKNFPKNEDIDKAEGVTDQKLFLPLDKPLNSKFFGEH